MISIEKRKYNIISQITNLNNEKLIQEVEHFFKNLTLQLCYNDIIKPLKQKVDINEMIKEQDFKGINRQYFDNLILEMDIKESLNELIAFD